MARLIHYFAESPLIVCFLSYHLLGSNQGPVVLNVYILLKFCLFILQMHFFVVGKMREAFAKASHNISTKIRVDSVM